VPPILYFWEHELQLSTGHSHENIKRPSQFDVVSLVLWSRLVAHLPERTRRREYRAIDGQRPAIASTAAVLFGSPARGDA
jgi:hypothetical protein